MFAFDVAEIVTKELRDNPSKWRFRRYDTVMRPSNSSPAIMNKELICIDRERGVELSKKWRLGWNERYYNMRCTNFEFKSVDYIASAAVRRPELHVVKNSVDSSLLLIPNQSVNGNIKEIDDWDLNQLIGDCYDKASIDWNVQLKVALGKSFVWTNGVDTDDDHCKEVMFNASMLVKEYKGEIITMSDVAHKPSATEKEAAEAIMARYSASINQNELEAMRKCNARHLMEIIDYGGFILGWNPYDPAPEVFVDPMINQYSGIYTLPK